MFYKKVSRKLNIFILQMQVGTSAIFRKSVYEIFSYSVDGLVNKLSFFRDLSYSVCKTLDQPDQVKIIRLYFIFPVLPVGSSLRTKVLMRTTF